MEEKKRALAHVEKIAWIKPIEGADNIELVGVLGWRCIAKKGEFHVGDSCVYIEIDSKVPELECFEFLRSKHFKIKTMKLNKFKDEYGESVVSQGIAIPLVVFRGMSVFTNGFILETQPEGADVTDALGVTYADPEDVKRKTSNPNAKYDSMKMRHKKIFSNKFVKKMMKHEWFRKMMFMVFGKKSDKPLAFPDWIKKTDEERIENLPQYLEDHETIWEMTEKIDGTSSTYAMERPKKKLFGKPEYELIVCSRKIRQRTPDQKCFVGENVYWQMAFKYDIQKALQWFLEKKSWIDKVILQGEIFGQNLQGNPYKKQDVDFRAFNLIFIKPDGEKIRLTREDMEIALSNVNIPCVPYLGTFTFPKGITMHEFKAFADGKSVEADVKREGIVFRDKSNPFRSFKNVSNDFLLHKK